MWTLLILLRADTQVDICILSARTHSLVCESEVRGTPTSRALDVGEAQRAEDDRVGIRRDWGSATERRRRVGDTWIEVEECELLIKKVS